MNSINEIYDYWKNPDENNYPFLYLSGKERTDFLVSKIKTFLNKDDSILELGCGVGRNLKGLYEYGYKNLSGIDINYIACEILKEKIPININVYNSTIELALTKFTDNNFDLIFTMAVLEHIHPDFENSVFYNIKRIAKKYILTIEDEITESERHCPRNYQDIFESEKFTQVDFMRKIKIKGLGKRYKYRLFRRRNNE